MTGSNLPFWFDYVADIGDGFSATYAIAERLALSHIRIVAARDEAVEHLGSRLLDQAELRIELALWTSEDTREYLKSSLQAADRQLPEPGTRWRRTVCSYVSHARALILVGLCCSHRAKNCDTV